MKLQKEIMKSTGIKLIPKYEDVADLKGFGGSLGSVWQDNSTNARWVPGGNVQSLNPEQINKVGEAITIINDWMESQNNSGKPVNFK